MVVHGRIWIASAKGRTADVYLELLAACVILERSQMNGASVLAAGLGAEQPRFDGDELTAPVLLVLDGFDRAWFGDYEVRSDLRLRLETASDVSMPPLYFIQRQRPKSDQDVDVVRTGHPVHR